MSQQLVVKPHRKHKRAPVQLGLTPALIGGVADGAPAPLHLLMPEPQDGRQRLISGGVSAAIHLGGLATLLLGAALAPPELIEKVIPVEIMREIVPVPLPGSNVEPAPAGPKRVGAARPNAAAMAAAAALSPAQAEALRQAALEAARRELQQMELEAQAGTTRPTQVERRQVSADRLAARAAATAAAPTTAVDVSELEAVQVDRAELAAIARQLEGPRTIAPSAAAELSAPEALAILDELGTTTEYEGAIDSSTVTPGATLSSLGSLGGGAGGSGVDTRVSAAFASGGDGTGEGLGGGGGSGGTGTATDVVQCLESAYVLRYLDMVQERTNQRWNVPAGVAPDARVVLRFDLDAAGMATDVRSGESEDTLLADSARRALLAAAPFPPMTEANRCLTEKTIILTFTVPRR
jgi:hypothetical protein